MKLCVPRALHRNIEFKTQHAINQGDMPIRAMVFDGNAPHLQALDLREPSPRAGDVLIDVHANP
ncbi:zinc-binding alcohol dehydrogenase family protein [Caballeronia insecticola]|uniref:Zinc-binding alcohol dehydrogenase family protein n=1 Tax=Caballeronia insecticola TaxID=758793 RepID=R4WLH4_9BURK|nr:zinc-binding alcohol dehydrogenase family protein [Caballeronia insecticola]